MAGKPSAVRYVLGAAPSLVGALLLALAVPKAAGTRWPAIAAALNRVDAAQVLLLCGLWGTALWAYTFVLSAALPGLSRPRALMVNCTSSAVSNVLPLGGGAGVAVTYAMALRWGHRPRTVTVCIGLTGMCNVATRLVISAVGALLLAHAPIPGIYWAARAGATLLVLAPAVIVGPLLWRRYRGEVQKENAAAPELSSTPSSRGRVTRHLGRWLALWRDEWRTVLHRCWPQLLWGMAATLAAQGLLFMACLSVAGVRTGLADTIAVFAASRFLTQIALTPGGIGVTDSAVAVALVHLGGAPGPVAASVLLFTTFTHLLEIPLGLVTGALWLVLRRRQGPAGATQPMPQAPPTSATRP
ncbi:lysylphosphatidylglycerol synthase transmembrane domain-containing protein [Streptomyces gilvosporeus]|uniref:TIGR00374 family protein n=1 Tax=Streptomyces gilvosporeus TaxID=553510 RepID=A0A1V0TK61_9ACTN|nr:lysylphosphatidylglycerol synthase transmembrane domain-containing protein [Streptomyces gilvosporeus]ARF53188.1 hypothetical protein B1H19_02485 [Streptomyces gilvosporeus]